MLSWMEWNTSFREGWTPKCTLPSKKERIKLYNEYLKEKKMNNCVEVCCGTSVAKAPWPSFNSVYSLGTIEVSTENNTCYNPFNEEKGNNPMNYATATVQAGTTETQDQRKYLAKRLDEVFYKKDEPLYAQFGLTDDEPPRTPKEMKQRLADGKYVIRGLKDTDNEDAYRYWSAYDLIQWRDPAKKADQDGYTAAVKSLRAARQTALDTIKIDEPKAGLDAVKTLEAWTPTGAAN